MPPISQQQVNLEPQGFLRFESVDGKLFKAPKHLCIYLNALSMFVECATVFSENTQDSEKLCLHHCTRTALVFIFEFLQHYHELNPKLLQKEESAEGNNFDFGDKTFNDKWIRNILAAGSGTLADTIRAAHFLHNEYLFRVLINGCNSVLMQGTPSHVRSFFKITEKRSTDTNDFDWIDWLI